MVARDYGAVLTHRGRSIALKPASTPEYWSERYRINCRVWYLPFGWRITLHERFVLSEPVR
jgi:hypothetical protein